MFRRLIPATLALICLSVHQTGCGTFRASQYHPHPRQALAARRAKEKFRTILKEYLAACQAVENFDRNKPVKASLGLVRASDELGRRLAIVATAGDTDDLLVAFGRTRGDSHERDFLIQLIAKVGDPDKVTLLMLELLKHNPKLSGTMDSAPFVALDKIELSSDPAAIAYMIAQLQNPDGDREVREAAYGHLAGHGDIAGLKAVLAARKKRTSLPTIEARLDLDHLMTGGFEHPSRLLAQRSAHDGRIWGLVKSGILGNVGDLWLVEKISGRWTHPVFTGAWLDEPVSHVLRANPPPPDPTYWGQTAKQLVAGAWFKTFVGNPDLVWKPGEDLTPLEKKRFGLPPQSRDFNGDGVPDALDPWPTVLPRALSDAEKILAAAFEARYHFYTEPVPAVFESPPSMKPFEMVGWPGPVEWYSKSSSLPVGLGECLNRGIAWIRFDPIIEDNGPWEDRLIKWNAAHTQATVRMQTQFGEADTYTLTLQKFGADWVVVDMGMIDIT